MENNASYLPKEVRFFSLSHNGLFHDLNPTVTSASTIAINWSGHEKLCFWVKWESTLLMSAACFRTVPLSNE